MRTQEARADETHAGLQAVFFACFTEPAVPLDELEPHVAEHKAWIAAIEREGRIFAAGPLLDENHRFHGPGLIVLRAASLEEAAAICDADPFHQRGLRTYRLVPWQINEGSLTVHLNYFDRSFSLA